MPTEILSEHYDEYTLAHTAATTSKTGLLINGRFVLPFSDALANVENVFVYCAPAIRVPKVAAQAWVPETLIYWDDVAKNFTTTALNNTLAGYVAASAAAADVEGIIDLDPAAV